MRAVFALGLGVLLAPLLGCGPSFQTVYENDARFEHCYALDDTPTAAMEKKAACWNLVLPGNCFCSKAVKAWRRRPSTWWHLRANR